ncbi:MAG: iron complex outerrane recepter protein [Gammaproteobacteria bacterium]|nr:iron complex outerrane recepter protein [Gammaproteobacteria bacterium]
MNRTGDIHMNRIALAVKSALGIAMLVPPALVLAAGPDDNSLQEIVVTGIRRSVELSLEAKRDSTELTEVVTAEDIGKMPDKNVADSLARLPGITTSAAGANEGGFDENDRVSMRGTNPSLTQTLINGHGVAAGDWFVLDQVQTVGRSVSYTLLPSEIVSKVVVEKSSSASLVEGGVAGSVDIITRKPLNFSKEFTLEASVGAVYADLPSKTDGQYSALANFKNDANNFGIMLQLFSETRRLRRDGVEILGYDTIAPGSAIATAHPDLSGVQYPTEIGAAFFTQKRQRNGGMVDIEFKPTEDITLDLTAFSSKLTATNYNRNYLMWSTHFVNFGAGQAPDPGYVVQNNTLTKATFSGVPGTFYGVYDQISRPDETATANFVNLDTTWNVGTALSFFGQVGYSWGDGKTPHQDVSETQPGLGSGAGYQLNGMGSAPNFNLGNTVNTTPTPGGVPVTFGWIFGAADIDIRDTEKWAKIDSAYNIDNNAWKDLKFGVRYEAHDRTSPTGVAQGPLAPGMDPANYPQGFQNYPSNFNTFGGNIPTGIWYWTPEQLAAYNSPTNVNRDPITREYYQYLFAVHEKDTAAFVQADFKGESWAANVGVRYVHTQEDAISYTQVDPTTPGAILTSAFGPFAGIEREHNYNDVLPSANLKLDVTHDLVARFAASETMTRPDYSALAGFTNLTPPGAPCPPGVNPSVGGCGVGSGSGGNPDLKPIRSTNFDAGLEWYFAKRSLLSATAFYMDLRNYVGFGSEIKTYTTFSSQFPNGTQVPYNLTVPVNAKGRVDGLEFAYQQAFTDNIGFIGNYTYADGKQTSNVEPNPDGSPGDHRLVGTSKNTYNVSAYFENQMFNARVGYTYRSAFFSGLDRSTAFSQDAIGTLSAALGYTMNEHFSITVDAMNLNNPTLKYYALNTTQPRAFYKNGSQYYLNFRFKL